MADRTDKYFYPTTIAKCHKTIDGMLHTNKTQAEEIGKLRGDLISAAREQASLANQALQFKEKYERVVKGHEAVKMFVANALKIDIEKQL